MARSDECMSTASKVVLAVPGAGCVLAVVVCGGVALWWMRVVEDVQQGIEDSVAEMDASAAETE